MEVNTVYAGQGDNAVITHEAEAIVVDVNWPEKDEDKRKKQVDRMMEGNTLKVIILTGYDKDHANERGLEHYLKTYGAEAIMAPKAYQAGENEKKKKLKKVARKHGVKWIEVGLEDNSSQENILKDTCKKFSGELFSPHKEDADEANNGSIVMKITGKGTKGWKYLVTGDTENTRWERINAIFKERLKSDGVAIPHHGSKDASNKKTANLVDAEEAQASAGVGNDYGHPHKKAIDIWKNQGANVRQTNKGQGKSLTTWKNKHGKLKTETREEYELVTGIHQGTARAGIAGGGLLGPSERGTPLGPVYGEQK